MTNVFSNSESPDNGGKHEPDGVSIRGMSWIGFGLLSLVLATLAGVALGFRLLVRDAPLVTASDQSRRQPMIPGVMPNQAYDRQRIEVAERVLLNQYQWRDKTHRFARIPIERAIELMAQHTLSVEWPKNEMAEGPDPVVKSPDKESK